ncbi:MAG: GDP-mannose 4,6-dehydratase, partial [Nanoarchaeota archaeon]
GNKVIVLDNLNSGLKSYVHPKAEFFWCDVREGENRIAQILKDKNVEYVFHLVSLPYIPECFGNPIPFIEVNSMGTLNVLEACRIAKVRKVLVYSSAEIYGTKIEPIKESDKLNPQSTYGVGKIAAEQLSIMRFVEVGLPVVINRQFNVYSWRARHPYIIPELISQLLKSSTIYLGNIYAWRDFLFVTDAVNMAIELLEKGIAGEVYNIGAENCIQIKELAHIIGKIVGHRKIRIIIDKNRLRPWDISKLQSDNIKLFNTISYRPKVDLETGLKMVIKKYKENNKKWDF